jgi:tetratricopeptide (TPR) repeat protein
MRRAGILLLVLLTVATAAVGAPPAKGDASRARARVLADEGLALVAKGEWAKAEAAFEESIRLGPAIPADHYNLACVRARLGKPDAAIESLERAAAAGFSDFALIARDPDLDSLRTLPRFVALVGRKDAYLRRAAEATVVALRNRFGDDYHYSIDAGQRLIFCTAAGGAALERVKDGLRRQARSLGAALFEHGPDAYVTVLLPTPADYAKLVRRRDVPGMYVYVNRTVLARETGFVLAHEFTHALHAADRAPLGQEHAAWVYEGLGGLCEAADFGRPDGRAAGDDAAAGGGEDDDVTFTPRDNPRFARMIVAARRKGFIPLERLLAMTQDEFIRRPALTYGQAAYLMLYLWEKGLLRRFYDTYKATCAADPTGRAALETVTGMKVPELQEDWRLWLAGRTPGGTKRRAP